MPLIYPLSGGTNTSAFARYQIGGFSTLSSPGPIRKPSTFTNTSNKLLHKQFDEDGSNKIARFDNPYKSPGTYEIELISIDQAFQVSPGIGTQDREGTFKVGIDANYTSALTSIDFQQESLLIFQGSWDTTNGSQTIQQASIGQIATVISDFDIGANLTGFFGQASFSVGNVQLTGVCTVEVRRID